MISRRLFVGGAAANLAAATGLALLPPRSSAQIPTVEPWADKLVKAAESQIGVTVTYDAAYRKIAYPGGDVPREIGVCTDVVVRAYRDGLGIDLQRLVHEDMKKSFSAYPKLWGLASTDRNIDHRRVPNLRTYFPAPRRSRCHQYIGRRLQAGRYHLANPSRRPPAYRNRLSSAERCRHDSPSHPQYRPRHPCRGHTLRPGDHGALPLLRLIPTWPLRPCLPCRAECILRLQRRPTQCHECMAIGVGSCCQCVLAVVQFELPPGPASRP
jgi:uncharacterized protein YijF (DUF1287 family)